MPELPEVEVVRRGLHTLKGLAATVGAVELSEESARLEHMTGENNLPTAEDMQSLQAKIEQVGGVVGSVSFE